MDSEGGGSRPAKGPEPQPSASAPLVPGASVRLGGRDPRPTGLPLLLATGAGPVRVSRVRAARCGSGGVGIGSHVVADLEKSWRTPILNGRRSASIASNRPGPRLPAVLRTRWIGRSSRLRSAPGRRLSHDDAALSVHARAGGTQGLEHERQAPDAGASFDRGRADQGSRSSRAAPSAKAMATPWTRRPSSQRGSVRAGPPPLLLRSAA